MAKETAGALELATAALARRDYAAAELRAYLERRGVGPDDAAEVVERLEAAGYVDDVRWAAGRAAALAARNYGDGFIRADLERRGHGREQIELALADLEPERDRAAALVMRWGPTSRATRSLLAKGFDPETVADAVRAATAS